MSILDFLELPHLPNFLRFKEGREASYPIHRLKDKEIKALGKLWTEALLTASRKKRKNENVSIK